MGKPISIMLVDDEKFFLNDIVSAIDWQRHEFEITALAYNGMQAFDLYKRQLPDIVITDIKMPFMNGIELCQKIREISSDTKLLLISSHAEFEYASMAFKLDITDYILKVQIDEQTLLDKMKKLAAEIKSDRRIKKLRLDNLLTRIFSPASGDEGIDPDQSMQSILQDRYRLCIMENDQPLPRAARDRYTITAIDESLIRAISGQVNDKMDVFACFPLDDCRYAILIRALSVSEKAYRQYCLEMHSRLKALHMGITMCIDTRELDLVQAGTLYRENRKYISQKYLLGAGQIYDLTALKASYRESDMVFDFADIEELLKIHNDPLLKQKADEIFSDIRSRGNYMDLLNFSNGILEMFRMLLTIFGFDQEDDVFKDLYHGPDWLDIDAIQAKTMGFCEHILQYGSHHNRYSTAISNAIQFIHKNYMDHNLAVTMIAESVGLSASRLSVLFKQETGNTIVDYITNTRMKHAKFYLGKGKYKIYEIADMVGYSSGQYFSKIFKECTGQSPLCYKEGS